MNPIFFKTSHCGAGNNLRCFYQVRQGGPRFFTSSSLVEKGIRFRRQVFSFLQSLFDLFFYSCKPFFYPNKCNIQYLSYFSLPSGREARQKKRDSHQLAKEIMARERKRTPSPKAKDVSCEAKVGDLDMETQRIIHDLTIQVQVTSKLKMYCLLLPDATLSHMVKECRKLFSAFLCSKKRDKKSRL
jgi:hypothetical protein